MIKLIEVRRGVAYYLTRPIVWLLKRTPITPNAITCLSLLVAVSAAILISTEHLFAAGFVVLLAGFLDIIDGALARHTNRASQFGAILDSTLDRVAEAVILLGILVLFLFVEEELVPFTYVSREWSSFLIGVNLLGSLLVSYIRARAEALGLDCQVGFFTGAERVVILAIGLLLSQFGSTLMVVLVVIAVFSFVTVGQRLFYVWQQTRIK